MWPDRRLCTLLGIEHPIIQAPMVGPATPELAIAVCNAGGLGSLGSAEMPEQQIRKTAATMRAGTNLPFNLNFFVHPAPEPSAEVWESARQRLMPWYEKLGLGAPPETPPALRAGFDAAKLALVLDLRPPVVSFHFGIPDGRAIAALKQAGIVLLSTATSVAEAQALARAGVDAIIAQGREAGGHRGSHQPVAPADGIGTFALVPQVVDAVDVPVIAAGGIGDGRGIAAALALGASGVQMGTAFLSCPEAATDAARREMLRHAGDTDTILTDAVSGRAARAARSSYTVAMESQRQALPGFPSLYALTEPLLQAAKAGEVSFHLYGQAAALNREMPAAELVRQLVDDTARILAGLGRPA